MTKAEVRDSVGVLFVASHFAIIILVGVFYFLRGFTFDEATTTLAIITPVFASHTTLIVRNLLSDHGTSADAKNTASMLFLLTSFFFPGFFVLIIFALIALRAYNHINTFEEFKVMFGIVEGVTASYVALVLTSLFPHETHRRTSRKPAS